MFVCKWWDFISASIISVIAAFTACLDTGTSSLLLWDAGFGGSGDFRFAGICCSVLEAVKRTLLSCPYCYCFYAAMYFPSALGLVVVLLSRPQHLFHFCHVHLANEWNPSPELDMVFCAYSRLETIKGKAFQTAHHPNLPSKYFIVLCFIQTCHIHQ